MAPYINAGGTACVNRSNRSARTPRRPRSAHAEDAREQIATPLTDVVRDELQPVMQVVVRADNRHVKTASCSIQFADYQPVVHGAAGDDERISRVGAPRRPAPDLRSGTASVPEPHDSHGEA